MTTYAVSLTPVDSLLFGDNRSARAGTDHIQLDQDPSPVTLHGAIGKAILDWHSEENAGKRSWPGSILGAEERRDILKPSSTDGMAQLLGYCLCDGEGKRWFPKPRHARCERDDESGVVFYRPLQPLFPQRSEEAAWSCPHEQVLLAEVVEEAEEDLWVSEDVLAGILCASGLPQQRNSGIAPANQFQKPDRRVGIGMDNDTGLGERGLLFSRPYRAFSPGPIDADIPRDAGYEAWFCTLGRHSPLPEYRLGFLGGDRGRCRVGFESLEDGQRPLQDLLDRVVEAAAASDGFCAYLLTPHIQTDGLPVLDRQSPLAAAIGKPQFASGWNSLQGEPRKLLALAPPGSVYFYRWLAGTDRERIIRDHWLASISKLGVEVGYGRILVGVWTS